MWPLIFIFPGILILLSRDIKTKGSAEAVVLSIAASLSFFIISPWFIKYMNISLVGFAYSIIFLSVIIMIIKKDTLIERISGTRPAELAVMFIFVVVLLLRSFPLLLQLAPAGADMSMHTYIAWLISQHDGIPANYEPILSAVNFGAYPAGFPTISALISILSGIPVYRTGLILTCFTHAFFLFAIYVLLVKFYDNRTSLIGALGVSFLTRDPQWIIRWGGNPTVLSLGFFILALSILIDLKAGFSRSKVTLLSMFMVSSFLLHPIIALVGGVLCAVYLLTYYPEYSELLPSLTRAAGFSLILILPYLVSANLAVLKAAIEYSRSWQTIDARSAFYDLIAGAIFIPFALIGLAKIFKEQKRLFAFCSLSVITITFMVLNYKFWIIPFSYLLYPGRVALFLLIPLSIAAAPILNKSFFGNNKMRAFLIISGSLMYLSFYVYNSLSMAAVTKKDLAAFDWINSTISRSAVIANNYGDAGLWIPGIIGRKIASPHSFEILVSGSSEKKLLPKYIYIGSKVVYDAKYKMEDLAVRPDKYKRVYSNGEAQVWKILNPKSYN